MRSPTGCPQSMQSTARMWSTTPLYLPRSRHSRRAAEPRGTLQLNDITRDFDGGLNATTQAGLVYIWTEGLDNILQRKCGRIYGIDRISAWIWGGKVFLFAHAYGLPGTYPTYVRYFGFFVSCYGWRALVGGSGIARQDRTGGGGQWTSAITTASDNS